MSSAEQKYRVLLEITNALVSTLHRNTLFQTIAREIQKIPTYDRIGITLYDKTTDSFQIYVLETTGPPVGLFRGSDIPRRGSGMGWAFDHGQPLYRPEIQKTGPFFEDEHFLAEGLQSVVYLPLVTKGRVLGTYQVASRTPGRYSEDDIDFLSQVAKPLALALDNTLAYEEVRILRDQLHKENVYLQEEIQSSHNFEEVIGESKTWGKILESVERVAATDTTVLIHGETGTGKELIARAIHYQSRRSARPLIKVNCGALPAGLVESELFGHEKGAFTGALHKRIGRFELADQGTIFLDEIGDISEELQVKLLRVLQEQEFERVGGTGPITVNVRIITATNRDLEAAVARGAFRADLFYRLNVFPIHVPPLRERPDDIPLLAQYFIDKHAKRANKRIDRVNPSAMEQLMAYAWPGNVRELENVIERAVILCQGRVLDTDAIGPFPASQSPAPSCPMTLEEMERDYIRKVLEDTHWVIAGKGGAAEILKIHPNTLRSRLQKLGLKKP